MGFVKMANLPQNQVTHCVVSGKYQSVINDLMNMNITPILVPPCNDVQFPIACHADIGCYHLGENQILLYPYSKHLTCQLKDLGFQVIHTNQKLLPQYPNDILLNAARVGKWVICNLKYTDCNIINGINVHNVINTKQGYAKCSTLVVDENSIITSDFNIKEQANEKGIEVLFIQQGHICLDGYKYGLIGGCGCKVSCNTVYFTGNLKLHPDYDRIKQFLDDRNITIVNGSSEQLIDVGSILPIKEETITK